MSGTSIDPLTLQAYLETEYRVLERGGFGLLIGKRSPALACVHAEFGVQSSAFVTAFNPFSFVLSDSENARREGELKQFLFDLRVRFLDGIGRHPSSDWPGECSVLALGISLTDARALGCQFGQNAIVWAGEDAVPQLILLR